MIYKMELNGEDTLLEVMRKEGIPLESPCNGRGYCGKCKVRFVGGGPLSEKEKEVLASEEIAKGIRLACYVKGIGTVDVELLDEKESGNVLTAGYLPSFTLDSLLKKTYKKNVDITRVFYGEQLLSEEAGDTEKNLYGVALDIGTTTIAASLYDLTTGEEVDNKSALNPQKEYGLDVLSRIQYVSDVSNGLELLKESILHCINELVQQFEVAPQWIYEMVVSANTTMLHLLLGVDPSSMGRAPYEPAFTESKCLGSEEVGIGISPFGKVYLLPSIASFVGGDIVAGIAVSGIYETDAKKLFIDVGTNGEIVFSDQGKMVACSCAAGPALEGMNISCGMRGTQGAIEEIKIDDSGDVILKVIGDEAPKGVCGSGILSIISELNRQGYLEKTGRLKKAENMPEALQKNVKEEGKKRSFLLYRDLDSGREITITQGDIRQVQLAKGAILSGILALLKNKSIEMNQVDEVIIAGQFGYYLSKDSLIGSGLLPEEVRDKISYIGNASRNGAVLTLLSRGYRQLLEEIKEEVDYIELSLLADYDKLYMKCLSF